jgi:hypothetical protein
MRRRRGGSLLCLALALWLGGCAAGPRARPSTDPGNPRITDTQRNRAMLSIHAHALAPDRNFGRVQFMDFEEAIGILLADTGRRADSRARRAIAELTAYTYPAKDYRSAAVDRLLRRKNEEGKSLDIDYDELIARLEAAAAAQVPPLALSPPVDIKLDLLQVVASNLLLQVTPTCPYVVWKTTAIGNPSPVLWVYELWVPRAMEDVARPLDPQGWNQSSTLFTASYLVDTPSCCPKSATSDCSYTRDPNGDPMAGSREAAGQPYPYTAFFESFCVGPDCPNCKGKAYSCDAAFKNLLCVRTDYDRWVPFQCLASSADRYDVAYHHAAYLFGELNTDETGNDITTDQGELSVRRPMAGDPSLDPRVEWSFVHVDKTLTFKDPGNTIGVGDILKKSYAAELQQQIAEQACYDIPVEWWFAP